MRAVQTGAGGQDGAGRGATKRSSELSSTLPQSGLRRLRWLLVLLVLSVGLGSAVVAWRSADDDAERDDRVVAQEATDLIGRTVDLAELGLAGAGAIVPPSGPVPVGTFEAYARDVLGSSSLEALAFEPVVPAAQRPAFEADLGAPIIDRAPDGPAPAPQRDVHYPVRALVPQIAANRGLLGFDLAGDPVRRAAAEQARDSGEVVFSEPVPSQPSGTPSFFLVKALYRPGRDLGTVEARRAALVGFVSSAYTSRLFAEAIGTTLPEGTAVELRDGDTLLADTGDAAGGVAQETEAGRRTWMLLVDGPASADHGVAVAVGLLALVMGGGLAFLFLRGTRHDREVRRSTEMIARTADLAQALAGAESVDEVEQVVFERVPAVLGARVAGLAFLDLETDTIVVHHPEVVAKEMAHRYEHVPLDRRLPITEVAQTGRPLLLRDHEAWRRHTTLAVIADVKRVGLEGTVVLPIHSASGRVMATLSIAWSRPIDLDDSAQDTVSTISEICQYALQRAMATDDAARRATELAALAEHLASATTTDEVGELVTRYGRSPVEAAGTSIGLIHDDHLVIHHGETVPDEYRRTVTRPSLDADLAITEVARTGTMLLFETHEAYAARFPRAAGPLAGARAVLPLRRGDGETIGIIAHIWNGPREFDEALISTLTTIGELTGQALARARLAQAQAEDARHTEALARLAQGLTSRMNSDAVMAFLTQGVLGPLDAYHAAVAVIEGQMLRRHFTPGRLTDSERSLPADTPLDADTPLTDAARFGEPVLLPDDEALETGYPHLVDAWRSVGFQATANLPLRDGHGRLIGALGIAWDHPVTFGADLKDRLSTVAGIAGQTLERTQLVDRLREDARRNESLAELAEVLATARSSEEVIEAVANQAARVINADGADVAIIDSASHRVRIHLPNGADDDVRARIVQLETSRAGPHVDVLRDGGTLTFPDRETYVNRYPDLGPRLDESGYAAAACTELRDSAGHRVGALGFGWTEPVTFDEALLAGIRSVADLCSQALERAQLSDAEHRLVTTLQSSVLAPLPDAPGLACAARYLPAARDVGMGGDWYEGVVLPKDRYAIVLGDVAGHGITAVGQMAQFRSVLGALIRLDTPLDELFPLATSVVHGESPIATAVVVVVDQAEGVLRYAAAGHPPPLLRMPDGEVVMLDQGRHPLLGVPTEPRPPGEHPFPPGATLLCYTDGLVERRVETIEVSIERLARALAAATAGEAETLADDLLATLLPGREMADDVALAVITRGP
ncbi:MAG TPA: SpoIIE family protein phosphatase [Acidimicrobiales bacterium]|nr:SpoIIE family protein phosphatase [Acidimicrobiales bacterium]